MLGANPKVSNGSLATAPDWPGRIEAIRQRGGKIIRDAGPMNAGTTIIAFVEDPDGYQIELIGPKG